MNWSKHTMLHSNSFPMDLQAFVLGISIDLVVSVTSDGQSLMIPKDEHGCSISMTMRPFELHFILWIPCHFCCCCCAFSSMNEYFHRFSDKIMFKYQPFGYILGEVYNMNSFFTYVQNAPLILLRLILMIKCIIDDWNGETHQMRTYYKCNYFTYHSK